MSFLMGWLIIWCFWGLADALEVFPKIPDGMLLRIGSSRGRRAKRGPDPASAWAGTSTSAASQRAAATPEVCAKEGQRVCALHPWLLLGP